MNSPLVSVIIPTYNAEKYISACIDSMLMQTYKNIEIIIVDDGSSDNTESIIKSKYPQVKFSKNPKNLGISKTRNTGIKLAQGEFICTMDADDWSYPDRIKKQVEILLNNDKIGIVGGYIEVCDKDLTLINKREYPLDDTTLKQKIFTQNPFAHSATLIRKEAIIEAGGYNPDLKVAVDYDIYFRIGRKYKFANLNDVVTKLRTNPGSITQKKGARQEINSLYIRLKATLEWGYKMTLTDKIFFVTQLLSVFIIPFKVKFWLYNFLRSK